MAGIVVFGGTSEGRLIGEAFRGTKVELHICVATEYGASLLPAEGNVHIHTGRMGEEEMEHFLARLSPDHCLDATHPYAAAVTENIYQACSRLKLPYIRVLREEEEAEDTGKREKDKVIYAENIEEAVRHLDRTQGNILITTGSKDLEKYTHITDYKERCFARVLPTVTVMERCRELGFEGKNLIGMQGPFSEELNYAMIKQLGISWMVTKSSGKEGGYQEKCGAAHRAGANLLVIGRPSDRKENAMSLTDAIGYIRKQYGLCEKRELFLIGMGPGNPDNLTKEAQKCLKLCDVIIGAGRILDICKEYRDKPFYQSYRREEIAAFLRENKEYRRAALVYSGDIGFYSGAKGMGEYLEEFEIHPVSGIASPIYFLDRLGIPWEEVPLISGHGQEVNVLSLLKHNKRVCMLLGGKRDIAGICRKLVGFHMEKIKITAGERLSYPEERIISGYPAEWVEEEFDPLSVVLFENPAPVKRRTAPGIEDERFCRGKVPMTKQEIRILSLAKLQLKQDSVLYDIGAGTGSVSIEAALLAEEGKVIAVERNPEGADLIRKNCERFGIDNIRIVQGEAPKCFVVKNGDGSYGLQEEKEENGQTVLQEVPTHAFIGGSGGKLTDIIRWIRGMNEKTRFVVNAVTLETMSQIMDIKEEFPEYEDMEVVQVNVARSKAAGKYHLMSAENPVHIICFGGEKEEV